jgi:eukaryotic-like serine/threonine-protein kinase
VLRDRGEHAEALAELDRLLPLEIKAKGAEHIHTLATRALRAAVLVACGSGEDGKAELLSVAAAQSRVLPPDHRLTLRTGFELAQVERKLGNLPGAAELMEAVAGGRERALGREHPETRKARTELAAMRASIESAREVAG